MVELLACRRPTDQVGGDTASAQAIASSQMLGSALRTGRQSQRNTVDRPRAG